MKISFVAKRLLLHNNVEQCSFKALPDKKTCVMLKYSAIHSFVDSIHDIAMVKKNVYIFILASVYACPRPDSYFYI